MTANVADLPFVLFFLLIFFGAFALFIWGLVDSITQPDWAYTRAGSNKVVWVLVIVLIGVIGAAIYFLTIRPRLVAAKQPEPAWSTPAPMAGPPPAAWYPDPMRRHQARFWNGRTWTDSVSDNGRTATDPLQGNP